MEFKRMSEAMEKRWSLFWVITHNAELVEKDGKSSFIVDAGENPYILTTPRDFKEYMKNLSLRWYFNQMELWACPDIKRVKIATSIHPLAVAAGDTCFILVIEGREYIVAFYRDISKKGWLIPGGSPGNLEELLNLRQVAWREGCEEVIIMDTKTGTVYSFGSPEERLRDIMGNGYGIKISSVSQIRAEEAPLIKGNAQRFVINVGGRKAIRNNYNVTVDPEIPDVSVTFYRHIYLPIPLSRVMVLDGETNGEGKPIDRFIRLSQEKKVIRVFRTGSVQTEYPCDPFWRTKAGEDKATIATGRPTTKVMYA